jgi:hypothetical protein
MVDDVESFYNSLFRSSTQSIHFVAIEQELEQLADYGLELLQFTEDKLSRLKSELTSLSKEGSAMLFSTEDGIEILADDVAVGIENVALPNWHDNVEFLAPAMLLMSAYIFAEKQLKNLCYAFADGDERREVPLVERLTRVPKVKPKSGEGSVDALLRHLSDVRRFKFELDADEKNLLDSSRRVRNDFAHGDWQAVRAASANLSFERVLGLVYDIFAKIEAGMPGV